MTAALLFSTLLLAIVGHGYLWMDGVNLLHAWPWPRKLIDRVTLACLLIFLAMPLLIVWHWQQLGVELTCYAWSQNGFLQRYIQLCAVWGAVHLLFRWLASWSTNHPSTLLHWRQETVEGTEHLDASLLCGTYPRLLAHVPGNQILQITVDYKQLAIPRLHAAHQGLKIAHISDLHITGRVAQPWFDRAVQEVNNLQPDVIAITGDIVEKEACWPWLADSLGQLRAKYGVYFILGNHDAYVDVERTRTILTDLGLVCLGGRWLQTTWNDAPVVLAGNELPWIAGKPNLSEAPGREANQLPLRLVLVHTPDQFAWACRQDANLVLAGHTHGGQICFPLLGPVASPSFYGTRYACGVFRKRKTVLHVSRGLSGKTPLRWNCPPEITLLELAALQDS